MLILPNFWMWHPSGNGDAQICDVHAALVMNGRYYLAEQVTLAMRKARCAAPEEKKPWNWHW
jgi:hypothetical protein